MELVMMAALVGLVYLLGLMLWQNRCRFGLHPVDGRRMRPGRQVSGRLVTMWDCGRCNKVIATSEHELDVRLLRTLRQQIGVSRARSKVMAWQVVRNDKEKSA